MLQLKNVFKEMQIYFLEIVSSTLNCKSDLMCTVSNSIGLKTSPENTSRVPLKTRKVL